MIVGATSLVAICFLIVPPIAQDPLYHVFADGRTLHNVPNFWNVVSNIPFFIVALYGIKALHARRAFIEPWERIAFCTFLAGTAAVGVGSVYYHLRPDDARLVWDRRSNDRDRRRRYSASSSTSSGIDDSNRTVNATSVASGRNSTSSTRKVRLRGQAWASGWAMYFGVSHASRSEKQ